MNRMIVRQMLGAEILKLRRHRPTMATALILSVAISVLYFVAIELRHQGNLAGTRLLANGTSLMGLYFGSFGAVLIGAVAGTIDIDSGLFRDLAATGRSRTALFLVRIPAAVVVALACTLSGVGVALMTVLAFGSAPLPGLGLILQSIGWVVVATAVTTTLAVGVASLIGSRSLTLTLVLGWQTIVTGLLYGASFLGHLRDTLLLVALSRLQPGVTFGSRDSPGSSNTLPNYELPMTAAVAILVLLVWVIVPTVVGAWRTNARDA